MFTRSPRPPEKQPLLVDGATVYKEFKMKKMNETMPGHFENGERAVRNVMVAKSELAFTRYGLQNVPVRVNIFKFIVFKISLQKCACPLYFHRFQHVAA